MLVVVHDRTVESLDDALLDLEAPWSRDVFEVDGAEAVPQPNYGVDDLVDVVGVENDGDGVEPREVLEQCGFALHDRKGRPRSDVAEPEDRGTVGDDGDEPVRPRVLLRERRVLRDCPAHLGDARGIGDGQVALGLERCGEFDGQLPPTWPRKISSSVMADRSAVVLLGSDTVVTLIAPRSRTPDRCRFVRARVSVPQDDRVRRGQGRQIAESDVPESAWSGCVGRKTSRT